MNSHLKFDKQFARDFWRLLKPYWKSEEKWSAWGLLSLNIVFTIAQVRASVALNGLNRDFFNAMQTFNTSALLTALWQIVAIIAVILICFGYGFYFNQLLSVRWRRWLTKNYLKRWLADHTHYHLRVLNHNIDNPDQRISEDLDEFPSTTLGLFFMVFQSTLTLASFGYILWGLSGSLTIPMGSIHLVIPGYLCLAALLYALLGTWVTSSIGKKLSRLNYQLQQYNADFRFSLVRLREASEQVALCRGEAVEDGKFHKLFSKIFNNYVDMAEVKKRLMFFINGYANTASIFGLVISLPMYFAKKIQLGVVVQISGAFSAVIGALSIVVENFSAFASWRSVIHRLAEFNRSMDSLSQSSSKITVREHGSQDIVIDKLNLVTPDGRILMQEINLVFGAGQTTLLSGATGLGKSTFLRAMAGIWPYGEGQIHLPQDANIMFLPQKPYLPLGSLREVLLYPNHANESDEVLDELLALCGLKKLQHRLDENENWAHELSLGEQQLIAFARIFLNKPDVVFLDESTSALDEEMELKMYEKLRICLPNATIISVGHRSSLQKFHERQVPLSLMVETPV